MSARRMSFGETPDWLDRLGFQARVAMDFDHAARQVIVRKGSLVFGSGSGGPRGFVVDEDERLALPPGGGDATLYLTADGEGAMRLEIGDAARLRGLGSGATAAPWYTFGGRALIGKCFFENGLFQGAVACDDVFWCEFEGGF